MDIYGSGVLQKPTVVELSVQEIKVEHTVKANSQTSTTELKEKAIADLVDSLSIDVLVEPTFHIESSGSTKRVTVQGFPGTYENFHPIQSDELTLLEAGVLQKAEVVEGDSSLVEKNKTGRNILFFLLAGVGVAIALGF